MPLMKVKGSLILELKCFFKSVLISKSFASLHRAQISGFINPIPKHNFFQFLFKQPIKPYPCGSAITLLKKGGRYSFPHIFL